MPSLSNKIDVHASRVTIAELREPSCQHERGEAVPPNLKREIVELVRAKFAVLRQSMMDEVKTQVKIEVKNELQLELETIKQHRIMRDQSCTLATVANNDRSGSLRTASVAYDHQHLQSTPGVKSGVGAERCSDTVDILSSAQLSATGNPMLDAVAHELGAKDVVYEFSETVYDAVFFIGLKILSRLDTFGVAFVALLNLAAQGCFIGLVFTMLDNDFANNSIVTTLEQWRVLYAHNPDFADAFTDTPLAMDICETSFFRMQGASQASLYNDLHDYTKPFLAVPSGASMCLLAAFLWMLTCAREFKRTGLFFIGMWTSSDGSMKNIRRLPYEASFVQVLDNPVMWIHGEARQKNYQVVVTPQRALALTILLFLPRAIIAGLLASVGCLFLVQTVRIDELMLNAVALDVVMNTDELLFDIFVPAAARRMVFKTMPLRVPRTRGTCRRATHWIKMAVMTIILMAVGFGFLGPMVKIMEDVKRVMCDGDRDFLAIQLPYGPMVATKMTGATIDHNSYKYRAIYQRTRLGKFAEKHNELYIEGGRFSLPMQQNQVAQMKKWRDQTISDLAALPLSDPHFADCSDLSFVAANPSARTAFLTGVGAMIGNESMRTCGDVDDFCFSTSLPGQIARFVCPERCGSPKRFATDSRTGLFFDSIEDGTPKFCRDVQIPFALQQSPCQDPPLSWLLSSSGWRRYAEGASSHFDRLFLAYSTVPGHGTLNQTHYALLKNLVWQGMSTHGCDFFRNGTIFPSLRDGLKAYINLCDPYNPGIGGRRTIRNFCPKACKCDTAVKRHYEDMVNYSLMRSLVESQCPLQCVAPGKTPLPLR